MTAGKGENLHLFYILGFFFDLGSKYDDHLHRYDGLLNFAPTQFFSLAEGIKENKSSAELNIEGTVSLGGTIAIKVRECTTEMIQQRAYRRVPPPKPPTPLNSLKRPRSSPTPSTSLKRPCPSPEPDVYLRSLVEVDKTRHIKVSTVLSPVPRARKTAPLTVAVDKANATSVPTEAQPVYAWSSWGTTKALTYCVK